MGHQLIIVLISKIIKLVKLETKRRTFVDATATEIFSVYVLLSRNSVPETIERQ